MPGFSTHCEGKKDYAAATVVSKETASTEIVIKHSRALELHLKDGDGLEPRRLMMAHELVYDLQTINELQAYTLADELHQLRSADFWCTCARLKAGNRLRLLLSKYNNCACLKI